MTDKLINIGTEEQPVMFLNLREGTEPVDTRAIRAKRKLQQDLLKSRSILDLAKDAASLAKAVATGTRVSDERIDKRLEICAACPKVIKASSGLKCGICGCKVKGDRSLVNLALYEETDKYGCKFPGGSKWKEGGA